MTPEQIALCQRCAAESAQQKWAREWSDNARRAEAEDARVEHRVGFRCSPSDTRAWWAVWEPAFLAALDARSVQSNAPLPYAWGGAAHLAYVRRTARHARAVHDACVAYATKNAAGTNGPCSLLLSSGEHLARTEAWDGTFLDVSGVAPAHSYSVPSLPWISDPLGALRHLAHMVSASLPDQWAFHEEQAVHAAAATLASLDDVRRGAVYGVRYHEHLARMMSEVTP
jgi:hypothetical protein